ncbi:putative transmembrane sensor domain protein (plasmid) [Chondrocystis sp. NIES-4102]|nr:putative transmembrane sensor domain protein [Chondrocystis sp. NIES-4102]
MLKKISQQQPRIIGLDLYRDLPVFSPRFTDEVNIKAYNDLQNLFKLTDNIIGIEKVIEPLVNAPKILKDKNFVAASDIPSDYDNLIRRSYVFPEQNKVGKPAGIPYFGVALGFQYLSVEGWNAKGIQEKNNILKIFNHNKSIILKPTKNFVGIPKNDPYGYHFLINWRKAKQVFRRVSVIDVIKDEVDSQLFDNCIVIIGNVSASTADRHYIALNRWSTLPWIYGLEIPAQVASSIISAALDNRPLINPINIYNEIIILIISLTILISYLIYLSNSLLNIIEIYLKSFICSSVIFIALLIINIFCFRIGVWIPIGIPVVNIYLLCLSFYYYYYWKIKEENFSRLECYVNDLHHSLGNPLNSIKSSQYRTEKELIKIKNKLLDSSLTVNEIEEQLPIILKRNNNIIIQTKKIERYRVRLGLFINYGYLNKTNALVKVNLKSLVTSIIERFIEENNYEYFVQIYKEFDNSIGSVVIDTIAIEIVLDNLLDNAFYAVSPKENTEPGIIQIKVQCKNNLIEFKVKDNGIGIPENLKNEVFKPFVSYRGGQGIGLYLCKRILHLRKGDIWISSSDNGTEFTFRLPITRFRRI